MKQLCFILAFAAFSQLISAQAFTIEQEGTAFYLKESKNNSKKELPAEISKNLLKSSQAICSPNGSYIAFIKDFTFYLYEIKSNKTKQLMAVFDDSEAISKIEWYSDESKFAFVNINSKRYKNKSMLFVLEIANGELYKKQKFDIPIEYSVKDKSKTPNIAEAKFSFHNKEIINYTLAEEESYNGIYLYEKYILIDNTKLSNNYNIVMLGEALPSDYAFCIVDKEGAQVDLPQEIQESLISPIIHSFTTDNQFLIYEKEAQLKSYNFETKATNYLMALFPDSEGGSNLTWSKTGNRCAFININQNKYSQMCKIFVLDIEDGKLTKKQKFDAPVMFHCGGLCYPNTNEFKFIGENKIQYYRHEMIENRPGEIDVIELQ